MDEYLDVHQLSRQGVSQSGISHRTGLDRKTVRKYLCQSIPSHKTRCRHSILDPFKDYLRKRLSQGCSNGEVLLREIREQGYVGQVTILRKFLHPLREQQRWRVELRWESAPGEYAQVDWGIFHAQLPDGSPVKLYAFVYTLAYSRVCWVQWTNRMNMATLQRCHEAAFAYTGGVPQYIIYDQMKTVVLEDNGREKIRFHPAFMDFAGYYGFTPRACPPRWPRGKGKVESGVKYVRRNFWQGLLSITGTPDLNNRCRSWLDQVANTRVHGTTGRIPLEMLEQEKLKSTQGKAPYPAYPAVLRVVSRDCLVSYRGCCYSLPAQWAGKSVWVRQVSGERIVVSAGNNVISEQPLEPKLKRTVITPEHYRSLRGRPRLKPVRVIPQIVPPSYEVERRCLRDYDALLEVSR